MDGTTIDAFLYRLEEENGTFSSLGWDSAMDYTDKPRKAIAKALRVRNPRYLGYVVNTAHAGVAGHWVAVLVDRLNCRIEYSDSLGSPPSRAVEGLLGKIEHWLNELYDLDDEPLVYSRHATTVRHQYDGWSCGLHALRFIKRRVVMGESFDQVDACSIPDGQIIEFRSAEFPGASSLPQHTNRS